MRADVVIVRLTTIDGGRMKDDIPFLRRFWGLISDQNLELEDLLPNTLHCAMLWSGLVRLSSPSVRRHPSVSLGVIVISYLVLRPRPARGGLESCENARAFLLGRARRRDDDVVVCCFEQAWRARFQGGRMLKLCKKFSIFKIITGNG